MADVNANIHIGIDASSAVAQLRALQTQISNFNRSVAAGNAAAAASQARMASSLASMVGATGHFNTSIRTMESGVASLGTAFDKGTLSARQYFRYAASQMPGLTKAFKSLGVEQAQMADLATNRVKRLQTQYVALGKDIRGMQKIMAITPKNLASNYATELALAQQRQQLFNRALQLGSTGLVNWGKNTQWAGRQLMVGFTVPLTIAAGAAAKFYMELDKASMQFRRVYGDLNTSTAETYKNLEAIKALGIEYTKYGTAVKDVIDIGARVAATGQQNQDLLAGTEQTLRLATLGQMEYSRALDAVTSLQTAFAISADELGNKINFLNAVENQTVLTMEDMAAAVPRVAPVIKGLGGDVEDLAVFMTALREGGVSAEQGANALKSGLASLINPTSRAQETLQALGININEIVQANKGDLMGTVKAFGEALNSLSEFERQQALETVFGKYQYARLGALFKNIANDSSQAARAMDLAGSSVEDLRNMAEKELSIVSETVTNTFLGAIERLKVAIAPVGEIFLKTITPIVNAVSAIANAFNDLPDGVKTAIAAVVGIVGGLAPVFLMGIGLIGNAIGNGLKLILSLRNGIKGLGSALMRNGASFQYQSGATLDAAAAMASLEGKVSGLTGDLLMQEGAVKALTAAYRGLGSAAAGAAAAIPTAFPMPGGIGGRIPVRAPTITRQGFNSGGVVPGKGNNDTVPALLTPGESVVTKDATEKYGPVIAAMNAGTLPGFKTGYINVGGRLIPAPTASSRSENSMNRLIQQTINSLVASGRDLTRATQDVSRIVTTAAQNASQTGARVTTDILKQTLTQSGLIARGGTGLVFAHGQAPRGVGGEELSALRRSGMPGAREATRIQALSNFGFYTPEAFNKGSMRGPDAARLFSDPRIVDRTMYPMYKAIAQQMGEADVSKVASDPSIRREVRGFASRIAEGLVGVTATGRAFDTAFYGAVDQALRGSRFSNVVQSAITESRKTSTYAFYGGEINRGARGERRGVTGAVHAAVSPVAQVSQHPSYIGWREGRTEAVSLASSDRESRINSARQRMSAAGMTETQVERTLRKYGSRIGMQPNPAAASAAAAADATTYATTARTILSTGQNDPYVASRRRSSPHALVPGDAASDGRLYLSTFKATVGTIQVPTQAVPQGTKPSMKISESQQAPLPAGARQLSDNLSAKQMAKGREAVAWRQFRGSLSGLAAVIAAGPVADIQKFAAKEAKIFANQIKTGVKAMKKGLDKIGTSVLNAGVSMIAKIPDRPGTAMSGAIKSLKNKVLDRTIPAAFSAMDRGAAQMKKLGLLASDMGQALMYKDIKSATKMLSNAIGGTAAIKPIVDSSKKLGNAIKNNWQTLRSATADIRTTFNSLGTIDAARMTSQIVGTTKIYDNIKANAISAGQMIKTFGGKIGERLRDVSTMFRSEGFGAAAKTAAQIVGLNQALGKGKESITKTIKGLPDASLRAFDKALGGYKQVKQSFANTVTNFGNSFKTMGSSMANAALRSFNAALGGWGALKQSVAGIGSAVKTAAADGAKAIRASLMSAARTIGGTAAGGGGMLGGIFGSSKGLTPKERMALQQRRQGMAMGGGMALSMASMIPFMNQDEEGKFMGVNANVAGMGMMGGGALLSMVGMVPGPLLAVAAAAAAAGVALAVWRNNVDGSARAAAEFGANIGGAANALTNMSSMMGKSTPTQQLTQLQMGITQDQAEAFGEFQGMMNTEAGQGFLKKLEDATSAERFTLLGDYVSAAIASGMMDTATGKNFAMAIASSLNDPVLGNAVSNAIAKQESGAKAMLSLAEKRLAAVQETSVIQSIRGTGPGPTGGTGVGRAGALMGYEQASQAIGSSIQIIRDFSEAAAMAEIEFKNGTISFAEYQNILNQSSAVQEQYGNVIRKSIALSTDRGATMQAVKSQLVASGAITEDQFGAIEAAAAEGPGIKELEAAGISSAEAIKASGYRLSDAISAVAAGMNPADVAAIMSFTKDLSTAAGQYYAQNMGETGAVQTAGFIMAAETGTMAGVTTPEETARVIDIGVNFTGNIADLQAFLAAVPEEKVMTVVTELEKLSPSQQQTYISSFQALGQIAGQEAALAITESDQYKKALEKARGEALTTKGTRRSAPNTRDVERITQAVTNAKDSGVFTDLTSIIDFILNEEPSDLVTRLPELTELAERINENIPPEIQKTLGIDINNPEDLEKYGPMAEDLGLLVPVLEKVPDDLNKDLAVSFMIHKNGKAATPQQFAKDINRILDIQKDFESGDMVLQKKAILELLQEFRGPDGSQLTEEQALNAFNSLVERFGAQQIANLPWDVVQQVLAVETDVAGINEAIAAIRAAQEIAPEGWMAQRIGALEQLRAAAQNQQVSLISGASIGSGGNNTGSGSGGAPGGGGETKKSGSELIKEMLKDLQVQLKFLGDFKKAGDKVKSGLAEALRNAGAPEQLIADIISKGADGIKIAQALLKKKSNQLKKLIQQTLEVTRLTFVEQQRAEAANLTTQAQSQMALARSGVNPNVVANMEPEQAQAAADAYNAYQAAQRKADAAKGDKEKKKANRELANARKEWQMLTGAINQNTRAQERNALAQAVLGFANRAITAQRQTRAQNILVGQKIPGMTNERAAEIAGDEENATAIISANRAVEQGEAKVNKLLQERSKYKPESKKYKELTKQIEEARKQLRAARQDQKDLNKAIEEATAAEKAAMWASILDNAKDELDKTKNAQKFLNMGIKDQATLTALNNLSLEEQNEFLSMSPQKQKEYLDVLTETTAEQQKLNWASVVKEANDQLEKSKNTQKFINMGITDQNALNTLNNLSLADQLYFLSLSKEEQQKYLDLLIEQGEAQADINWSSTLKEANDQLAKVKNSQKFINMGIKDQNILNALNNLSLEEQNKFLSLSAEEQEAYLNTLRETTAEQQKLNWAAVVKAANDELEKTKNTQKFINMGITDQNVLNALNNLSLADQLHFLSLSAEEQEAYLNTLRETTAEQQKLNWSNVLKQANDELAKLNNQQKFLNMGIKDQNILNALNNLSLEDQNYFLSLSKEEQDAYLNTLRQTSATLQKINWISLLQSVNDEISKQINAQKFINMGIKDQLLLNKLNELSLEDQNYFLSLNKEEQDAFLVSLAASIPLLDKITQAFEQISAAQERQSLLNEDATNNAIENRDVLEDQLELLDDQAKAKQKEIDAVQDTIEAYQEQANDIQHQIDLTERQVSLIQRQNDYYNRGLELISRQEEDINKSYDERLKALDNVQKINARIAQQQKNQLDLSQALSSGDIYAATQAAQQIKQENASASIENTKDALEKAKEAQLKNLTVEINGELLTREEIQKRITDNEDRIYQLNQLMIPLQDQIYSINLSIYNLQEDILEPLQKQLDLINDQQNAINELMSQWDRYYNNLEENAVDPLTGLKYKDLNRLKAYYDNWIRQGKTAAEALALAIQDTGIAITPDAFYKTFNIDTSVTNNEDTGPDPGDTSEGGDEEDSPVTTDVNAARDAAILALPEVQKVLDVVKEIEDIIKRLPQKISDFAKSLTDTAQPATEVIKNNWEKIKDAVNSVNETLPKINDFIPTLVKTLNDQLLVSITAINTIMTSIYDKSNALPTIYKNAATAARSLANALDDAATAAKKLANAGSRDDGKGKGKFAGGVIPGGVPRDSVSIMASPGEFVIRNAMVDKYGIPMLNDINQGSFDPRFRTPNQNEYGNINSTMPSENNSTMYNNTYSISVNANTNASADEIANIAVAKIRQINSMQIRGARG